MSTSEGPVGQENLRRTTRDLEPDPTMSAAISLLTPPNAPDDFASQELPVVAVIALTSVRKKS